MRIAIVGVVVLLGACTPQPSATIVEPEPEPVRTPTPVIVEPPPPAPACAARSSRGALALVPDFSQWIVHLAPRELLASPAWAVVSPLLANDADWREIEQAFSGCGVPLTDVDHVLFGFDAQGEFVAVLAAPGIGRPEVARCLMRERQEGGEQQTFEVEPWSMDPSVGVIEATKGRGYLFADDVFAMATPSYAEELGELGRCAGRPALAGASREVLERVDLDAPIWLAARKNAELSSLSVLVGAGGEVSELSLTARVDSGLALQGQLRMTDASGGQAMATSLRNMLQSLAAMPDPRLVQLAARVTVDQAGADVLLGVSLSVDELRGLTQTP